MSSNEHVCSLPPEKALFTSRDDSCVTRCKKKFQESILISEKHPQCRYHFNSDAKITYERKRQLRSKYAKIIHPLSKFRFHWEGLMIFVLSFTLIYKPIDTAFLRERIYYLPIFVDLMVTLDIIVKFRTGYMDDTTGHVILERRSIAKHYLKSTFALDLMSSFPAKTIIVLLKTFRPRHRTSAKLYPVDYLYIISLLRIFRLHTLLLYISNFFDANKNSVRGTMYFILCTVIIHWTTCMHYIVPHTFEIIDGPVAKSWITQAHIISNVTPSVQIYFHSLYRSCCFLFCVHQNLYEVYTATDLILACLTFIMGSVLWSFIFIAILQMLIARTSSHSKYDEVEKELQEYMRHKSLPIPLQRRLMTYYNFRFRKSYFKESAVTATMPDRLRRASKMYCSLKLIKSVPLFNNLPQEILNDIVMNLKHEIFLPNDILVKAGTIGDCMYFLASGTVTVLTTTRKEVCHLQDGAYFGEIALLMINKQRIANVIAIEVCEVYRLNGYSFRECFPQNSELYKQMESIALSRLERTAMMSDVHKKHEKDKSVAVQFQES